MKNKILVILLTIIINQLFAQQTKWSMPPYILTPSGNTTEIVGLLPTPTQITGGPDVYDGSEAEFHHNAWFDANGELQFFIIDGKIYDKNGYLISSAQSGSGQLGEIRRDYNGGCR